MCRGMPEPACLVGSGIERPVGLVVDGTFAM